MVSVGALLKRLLIPALILSLNCESVDQTLPQEVGSGAGIVRENSTLSSFDSVELSLLVEARRSTSPPVGNAIVGIIKLDEAVGSALVLSKRDSSLEIYSFTRERGVWVKGSVVESLNVNQQAIVDGLATSPQDWNGPVAQLYDSTYSNIVGVLWSPAPWAGLYTAEWKSPTANLWRGKCLAGSQTYPAGVTTLFCNHWMVIRSSFPYGNVSCGLADCRWGDWAFLDNNGKKYGADDAILYFGIQTPLILSMSGPSGPITSSGTYTWTANPSGGDGVDYAYKWETSPDNSSWTAVGTSRTYSRNLGIGSSSFYLRVSVVSRTLGKTVGVYVSVNIQPPPLAVTVSGPTRIDQKGTYTWTASASGGSGIYSYQWVADYASGSSTLGTQATQQLTVYPDDGSFTIRVTVTGGGTVTSSLSVTNCIGQGTSCGVASRGLWRSKRTYGVLSIGGE